MTAAADTLNTLLSVEQAFPGSILEMPSDVVTSIQGPAPAGWWSALLIFNMVLLLACIPSLRFLGVRLLDCVWRWRGNFILEASIPYQRTRNILTLAMAAPLCMIIYRFDLVDWRLLAGFLLLRALIRWGLAGTAGRHRNEYRHAGICFLNYFIILVILMLVSLAFMRVFTDTPDSSARVVLWVEAGLVYLLHLVRKTQILRSAFPALQVFLYLCALEIVPCGLLMTAIVLL